jgi:hypothetical protein
MTGNDVILLIEHRLLRPQTQWIETARWQRVIWPIESACWLGLCSRRPRPSSPAALQRQIPSWKSTRNWQLPWLHPDQKKLCPSRAGQIGSWLAGPLQRCTAVSKRLERRNTRQQPPLSPCRAGYSERRYFSYFGTPRELLTAAGLHVPVRIRAPSPCVSLTLCVSGSFRRCVGHISGVCRG